MKKLHTVITFCFLTGYTATLNAQTLVPYLKKGGYFVLVDSATMQVRNPDIHSFSLFSFRDFFTKDFITIGYEGTSYYFLSRDGRKIGYKSRSGNFKKAYDFSEGLAPVQLWNGLWGFIDTSGNEIIPAQFKVPGSFYKGLATVKKDAWGVIDKSGKFVASPKYDSISGFGLHHGVYEVKLKDKWGLMDSTGKEVIAPLYDNISSIGYRDGFVQISKINSKGDYKYGIADKNGKVVIPLIYDAIRLNDDLTGYFKNGLAVVGLSDGKGNMKYGFVDKTGKVVIPVKYDDVRKFENNLAVVGLSDKNGNYKYGRIDKTGKVVIPIKYDVMEDYDNNLAIVAVSDVNDNYNYGVIDKTGKIIIPLKNTSLYYFSDSLCGFQLSDGSYKNGLMEVRTGKIVVPALYDREVRSYTNSEGLAPVMKDKKWGFIDDRGKIIISPKYDSVGFFKNGLACVKLNQRLGCIDKNGNEIIPFKYTAIGEFSEGLVCVGLNGKFGFVDRTGKEVVPPKYSRSGYYESLNMKFQKGFAFVSIPNPVRTYSIETWIEFFIDKAGREYREK